MSNGDKTEEILKNVTNGQAQARMVPGHSDSFLFKRLFQVTDTEIANGDTDEVKQSKNMKRLARLMSIKDGINMPFFRILEQSMLDSYYRISLVDIWEALKVNDHDKVQELLIEQQSYMRLFELFKDISLHIDTARAELGTDEAKDVAEKVDNPL